MEPAVLSERYQVRRLTEADVETIYRLCAENPLFYQHCPPFVTRESIRDDSRALPPGKTAADKYYLGYFQGGQLAAVLDLILDYPRAQTAFVGFFMLARRLQGRGVGSAIVAEVLQALARQGYEVTYLRPNRAGYVSVEDLKAALRADTVLVSMMLVNNELGTLQPVSEAVKAVKAYDQDILFHTDAVQALLKVPFSPAALGVDLLTVSGHKVRAPKGIGAQYVRRGLRLSPLLLGGGQEGGWRPGTEPTAQIAAFAAALHAWQPEWAEQIRAVKDHALTVLSEVSGLQIISAGDAPHICAVSLPGYPAEMLLRSLSDQGVCVSSGSACHRGKPSHVFASLGLPKNTLMGMLRISFGPENTCEDAEVLRDALIKITGERVSRS